MPIPKNLAGAFTEALYRTELDAVMLRRGYVPFLPVIDAGIDVIYYREDDRDIRFVQAKGRVCIYKKYLGRRIWVAFPEDGTWYLYPHDELVKFCESCRPHLWVSSISYRQGGGYSSRRIPPAMRKWLARWKCE